MSRAIGIVSLVLVLALRAAADTFTVNNTLDPGDGVCNAAACTLREAINAANANPGADIIDFNIVGAGVHTIRPVSELPIISEALTIDGYTQSGASENALVTGNNAVLLIVLNGSNAGSSDGLVIESSDCTIRGLVINSFANAGISVSPGSGGDGNNVITGNFIGTDPTGTFALGNFNGVIVDAGSGNTIGGNVVSARNLVSGNQSSGVLLANGASDNIIQGNYLGTDVNGTAPLANASAGVSINQAPSNFVGGVLAEESNVISSNFIGLELVGTECMENVVQRNNIGTDATGAAPLGNSGAGVSISGGANGNTIGATNPAGNIIAFNGTSGIFPGIQVVDTATGNSIFGNSTFGNTGLGIDLVGGNEDANGVTANDFPDSDTGPNDLLNYPVISSIAATGAARSVEGELASNPDTDYILDFYSNTEVDPSGYGEGDTYLGFLDVHTDMQGQVDFSFPLPPTAIGRFITATASDPAANTSEFSMASGLVPPLNRFLNISTRLKVQTGDNALIGGFIITGTEAKEVIVRAIGPSLGGFGVANPLANPILELHYQDGTVVTNNNWRETQETEIMATGLAPSDDLESAIVATLDPGLYTAIVRGVSNGTGVGLVEVYDLGQEPDSNLANISTRGFVETGDNVMIGGIIVGPEQAPSNSILLRGIGPSLGTVGIANPLADPTLELHDGNGTLVMANDNWKSSQQTAIEATGLQPSDDKEAAILATVAVGNYTVILQGAGGLTGVGLVEAYHLD